MIPASACRMCPDNELAGVVCALGLQVIKWKVGERVTVPFVLGYAGRWFPMKCPVPNTKHAFFDDFHGSASATNGMFDQHSRVVDIGEPILQDKRAFRTS